MIDNKRLIDFKTLHHISNIIHIAHKLAQNILLQLVLVVRAENDLVDLFGDVVGDDAFEEAFQPK